MAKTVDDFVFIICVVGIYLSYGVFSVLQEEINSTQFGEEKKKFKNTTFLVFLQCLGNCIICKIIILFLRVPNDKTPLLSYLVSSVSYVTAMFSSNSSIQYVNYPTMVLAKSCKPIPVLLMGILILGKRQTWSRYLVVVLITVGIYLFSLGKTISDEKENSVYGIALLSLSLAMDGITGPVQERVINKYNPSQYHMMYFCNWWSCILLGSVLVATGQGFEGIYFCLEHKEIIPQILMFCLTSAIGQTFIYLTIFKFGSLVCTLITTTRKFFSILISVVLFGHPLSLIQWSGVAVVFVGLVLDIVNSSKKKVH